MTRIVVISEEERLVASELIELLSNAVTKIVEAIRNTAKKIIKLWEENYGKVFTILDIKNQRNSWIKYEFTKVLQAHKKGSPLFMSHQVLNRKPMQCFARANI